MENKKPDALHTKLTALLGEPTEFNTCNSWGFGGGVGHKWENHGLRVKVFTAYYRHLPSERVLTAYTIRHDGADVRVFDEIRNARTERALLALLATTLAATSAQ